MFRNLRYLIALLLVFGLVAAACGSDDDESSGDETEAAADDEAADDDAADDEAADDEAADDEAADDEAADDEAAAGDADPAGVLRVATTLDRYSTEVTEVSSYGTATHLGINHHIYGTPLMQVADGSIQPYLAESWEIVDESTMNLTLQEGLTFQDGAPYDAQHLADTLLEYKRIHEAGESTAYRSSVIPAIDTIEVVSPTEVTFTMAAPVAGLIPFTLASSVAVIASPNSTADAPVGAGPYQIVEYTAEDKIVTEKWDEFYDADSYEMAGIEWYHIPAIEAAQTALEADQVDLIATNPRDVEALVGRGNFDSRVTNNEGSYQLGLCKSTAPFDEPEFREAVNLAINRDQLNQVVFGNNAQPMESLWNPESDLNVAGLIDPVGDPEAAEALVEGSSYDGSTVILGHYPGFQTHQLILETVQGQLAAVGINTEIVVFDSFVFGDYVNPETGGVVHVANINPDIEKVNVGIRPQTPWNPCSYEDADLAAMNAQISSGTLSDDEEAALWEEIQTHVMDNELWLPLTTQPAAYVFNTDRVEGIEVGTVGLTGATAPSPFLTGVFIKAG